MTRKIISLMLAVCMIFSAMNSVGIVVAADNNVNVQSDDEKRAEIKSKLDKINKTLKELGSQSKETEEYIAALDEKIQYLNEQFQITKREVKLVENRVSSLERNIFENEAELVNIKGEVAILESDMKTLNAQFSSTYTDYCERIRAIYESGSANSTLTFLMESNGIQTLLTRYEMVRAISKRDGALLRNVKEQTEIIVKTKEKLDRKKTDLSKTQTTLKASKESLRTEKTELLKKQDDMSAEQAEIEQQQLDANKLLKRLNDKTKQYGEYRDITQEELDAIDADIAEADKKYEDATPSTKKKTTTKRSTTKKKTTTTTTKKATSSTKASSTTKKTTTTTKKTTTTKATTTKKKTTTTTTTSADSYISLTYPCPKYKKITCGFGAYQGHTGCDFSTNGNENQKIVASESGTVILVKLLERSYGHYIVIRHDKKTRSGKTVYTLYAHNNDIIVSEGQYVKKGQKIANSGTTGNSTGPHCHFEVRVGGSSQSYAVNPANYL